MTTNAAVIPRYPGVYLEDHPPARTQWRTRNLDRIKRVIVLHTAEGSYAGSRNWIRIRTDAGSYQMLGSPAEITQMVRFEHAAYQCIGFNTTTIGISGALRASDWPLMGADERDEWVEVYAQMAAEVARFLVSIGKTAPAPVELTRAQALAVDASGFLPHSTADPDRRSDPGDDFPWRLFFARYEYWLTELPPLIVNTGGVMSEKNVKAWQRLFGVEADGVYGPITTAAAERYHREVMPWAGADATELQAEIDQLTAAKASTASALALAEGELADLQAATADMDGDAERWRTLKGLAAQLLQ